MSLSHRVYCSGASLIRVTICAEARDIAFLGAQVLETTGILACSMAVALTFPTYAEKIFAFTGCTAVCLVCYVIPVYIHLKLRSLAMKGQARQPVCRHSTDGVADAAGAGVEEALGLQAPLLASCLVPSGCESGEGGAGDGYGGSGGSQCQDITCWQSLKELALPILIVGVGAGCSLAGLWVAAMDVYHSFHPAGAQGDSQ